MQKKERAKMIVTDNELIHWSREKQKSLQEHLMDRWANDTWIFTGSNPKRHRYLRFTINSPMLKTEVKYAIWSKFESGKRASHALHTDLIVNLSYLIDWLNHFIPLIQSLMEKTLKEWETSFRSYLTQTSSLRNPKVKVLSASQEYIKYCYEDQRIFLLRQVYTAIRMAYDDRPETEKDMWDMRKMELPLNLAKGAYWLNFTLIAQPWLRHLAKAYIKYDIAIHSPGGCSVKLDCLRNFSRFLTERDPEGHLSASDIDRVLVVQYIGFLCEIKATDRRKSQLLRNLRIFLETSAHDLMIEELPKERIIFNEDVPKIPLPPSREIPEGVLTQLRVHLSTLPTTILRMVVILLECGLRISELCSLPLNCLTCDEEQQWSLHFYQMKSKQEHSIPLVDETIIQVIQAQQRSIHERGGSESPYLFPSTKLPLLPFKSNTFALHLNKWALEHTIRDSNGRFIASKHINSATRLQ